MCCVSSGSKPARDPCPGGTGIALIVAGVIFPVRVREALRKATAQLLEQLGDFAFFTLGEFCQARAPGTHA